MPVIEFLDNRKPPAVNRLRVELREPRPQTVRDAIYNPKPDFLSVLHGILPAVLVFDSDAKDAHDRLPPERGAIFFAVLAVGPRRRDSVPALPIGKQCRRNLGDRLHVEFAQGAAACVRYVSGVRVDGFDLSVPKTPELEQPLLTPDDVLLSSRILRVACARKFHARKRFEIFPAMHAIAHTGASPAV